MNVCTVRSEMHLVSARQPEGRGQPHVFLRGSRIPCYHWASQVQALEQGRAWGLGWLVSTSPPYAMVCASGRYQRTRKGDDGHSDVCLSVL